jgi:8-oxo-dGTP pyrophosphatase MutT (NUDIX family)
MNSTNVFRIRPPDFHPAVEVSASYLLCRGKLLLLKRSRKVPQMGTWGVPAGKVEEGERARAAAFRETLEETGITLHESLEEVGTLFVVSSLSFNFHMFFQEFEDFPEVTLSDEHLAYVWVTFKEALSLPLIAGGAASLEHFQELKPVLE